MDTLFPAATAFLVPGVIFVVIALIGRVSRHSRCTRPYRLTVATVGTILVLTGLSVQMRLAQFAARGEAPILWSGLETLAVPASVESAEPPQRGGSGPRPTPAAHKPMVRRRAARLAVRALPLPTNELRNLQAESVAGPEVRLSIEYRYGGDHGVRDVFLHAAVLQSDEWKSRVPGTSFPGVAVGVGEGSATVSIVKVPDTGASTSTIVRVCLVSLPDRSAFLCRNFDFTKVWD